MNEHHIRCVYITFGFHYATFARAGPTGTKMSLLQAYAFNTDSTVVCVDRNHAALRSLRRTGATHDLNEVASSNLLHAGIASGGLQSADARVESAYVSAKAGLSSRSLREKGLIFAFEPDDWEI
jgi:hypothetical protein